ncbi:MAG: hypothetical protein ACSHWW_01385 [Nonlabens sp.]|uniref:hypothetical protein n=1 Tax=Nonlabens sp. TaxID=1888209 RepID=UPI003EFA4124
MSTIRESIFYSEVIKEMNLPYGDFYFFEGFIVSEIFEGVNFTWEEAKPVIYEASSFYKHLNGELIYISNRINKYSVKPIDWLNFATYSFTLKGYGVINYSNTGTLNSKLEAMFVKSKFKTFTSIMDALQWAARLTNDVNA